MPNSIASAKNNATVPIARFELDISTLSVEDVFARLNSSSSGLTAGQIPGRLARHGPNIISVQRRLSLTKLLRENFFHTMALLLWATGAIAYVAQMPQLSVAVWLVNVVNGTFSFWQEYRAERATEALKELLPSQVQVLRDGSAITLPAAELVPGDVILVSAGDRIPADARLITGERLMVEQSTLTGESRPVRKEAQAVLGGARHATAVSSAEIANLLFAGTSVLTGHGQAVIYATGTMTEFGRIAHLTQTIVDEPSPLQREMARVTKRVTVLAIGIGMVIFATATSIAHIGLVNSFLFAIGMIVAFVPEGMVPTVTLALALAVQRMARRNALVKRLSSVETLGCTNVICTDKTGTLTKNQMTVVRLFAGDGEFHLSGLGYAPNGQLLQAEHPVEASGDLQRMLRCFALCNNASIVANGNELEIVGDPTEIALLVACEKAQVLKANLDKQFPRIEENPFDSRRKMMSTIHSSGDGDVAFVKGSPSNVLELSNSFLRNGNVVPLNDEIRKQILQKINRYASDGLRVIAAAERQLDPHGDFAPETIECELVFLGMGAMLDPPHEEVPAAVQRCRDAGIRIVMITGDYEVTAEAVARNVGIVHDAARIITGKQLSTITDPELIELIHGEVLFARVNPEDKLRIVRAFQSHGQIVAVTGDGVNDAPALKSADIGVAMGVSGTDVAKEASDMILLDDNFASIVTAIEEGRAVYDNIKKFAVYVFNSNMAEAVPFAVMLLSFGLIPMPLTIMQVLAIDLGTDMVPAVGLGADPPESGVMIRPPRPLTEPLLSSALLAKALLWYGTIEAVAGMSGYFFVNWLHGWPQTSLAAFDSEVWRAATTMTLTCIVASQIGAVFCCRSERASIGAIDLLSNRLILGGVLFELCLLFCLIYVPVLQDIFNTAPLGWSELCFAFSWIAILVGLDELRKAWLRSRELNQH